MSVKRCCVLHCNKTHADNTILHLFPNPDKDLNRFNIWKKAVGGDLLLLDQNIIYGYRRICQAHFEPQYHTRSKRLSPNAVPTLGLSGVSKPLSKTEIKYSCNSVKNPREITRKSNDFDSCKVCHKRITGFRYVCVQCSDWGLCGACEARGEHAIHYVLRIPPFKTLSETQSVLMALRQMLCHSSQVGRPDIALTQQSSQGSQNIIIESGHHQDQLNTRYTYEYNVIVNNNKKDRQKRYREQNRDKLKQREAERRKRIQHSQSIAGLSTFSNTYRIELNNKNIITAQSLFGLEKTQPSSIQRNEHGNEINAPQIKRERQHSDSDNLESESDQPPAKKAKSHYDTLSSHQVKQEVTEDPSSKTLVEVEVLLDVPEERIGYTHEMQEKYPDADCTEMADDYLDSNEGTDIDSKTYILPTAPLKLKMAQGAKIQAKKRKHDTQSCNESSKTYTRKDRSLNDISDTVLPFSCHELTHLTEMSHVQKENMGNSQIIKTGEGTSIDNTISNSSAKEDLTERQKKNMDNSCNDKTHVVTSIDDTISNTFLPSTGSDIDV